MDSGYMKAALSAYFRFKRGIKFIATECGYYNSDFLAITKKALIEIEIKISKADLNAEFKKPKHKVYADARSDWTPNQFYFAVPQELAEYAVAKCIDTKYGVCVIEKAQGRRKSAQYQWGKESIDAMKNRIKRSYDNVHFYEPKPCDRWQGKTILEFEHDDILSWQDRVRVVHKAKKLHDRPPVNKIRHVMIARLSSEMANLRMKEQVAKMENNK